MTSEPAPPSPRSDALPVEPVIPEASVEDELAAAWSEVERYRDALQRFRGEFSNYRRRIAAAREQEVANASAALIERLLPVADDLARASAAMSKDPGGAGGWGEGVVAIERKLVATLAGVGLEPISVAPGDPFDPRQHEALATVEDSEWPEDSVVEEVRRGYRLGGEVLRPALVRVSSRRSAGAQRS